MGFIDLDAIDKKQLREGINSRIVSGEKIMMAFLYVDSHHSDPDDSHPHEQCGVIMEGEIEMTIGGEVRHLNQGDTYFIPGDISHSSKTFEKPCLSLDIFSPPREDYL